MPSVPSIGRQKASTVLKSVEQSHIRDALPEVEGQLREVLTGEETLPDVPLLAALLGRVQVGGTQRLIAAEKVHEGKLASAVEPRKLRDEAGQRVHNKLVEVRRIAAGLFGPEHSAKLLGAPGLTAAVSEGERLWRQAEDTIQRLTAPNFIVPKMTTASLQFDPALLAAELEVDNTELRQALDAVALEQRKAETTLAAKQLRLDDAERIDDACRRIYEGFLLLADRGDLLDRLRRALRRGTRRSAASTDDGSPEPTGPPPAGESSPAGESVATSSSTD